MALGYVSLNRRWRPRSFAEVTRQEHVTRTLTNAIKQGRLAQAYLFGGRRGTGKTSLARILAMGLNCQAPGLTGPTAEPCGRCPSCEAVQNGTSPDVIELDAASNRGIDEIRALQENVRLSPMSGRYKVYIIDEAHQMTKDAYNAFLKTLEEPPPHVIFVLCTTEPEKIIPTVRSRCQRFDFRPLPEADIARRLQEVAKAEGLRLSEELGRLIARKAEGSLRDALGLLEQCVAFAGDNPTVADFLTVTGGVERDALRRLASLVMEERPVEVIAALDEMQKAGRDPGAVLDGLVAYLRDVFLTGLSLKEADRSSAEDGAADPELAADAAAWPGPRLLAVLDALVRAAPEMRYSPQPRLWLEMTLLGLALRPAETATRAKAVEVAKAVEAGGGAAIPKPAPTPEPAREPVRESRPGTAPSPGTASSPGTAPSPGSPVPTGTSRPAGSTAGGLTRPGPEGVDLQWFRDNWDELLDRIRRRSVFARAFLLKAVPTSFSDGVLTLSFDSRFHKERTEEEKNRVTCEQALSQASGVPLRLRCRLVANGNGVGGAGGAGGTGGPVGAVGTLGAGGASACVEPEPPPEERPVPRAEPVRLPPPAKPTGAVSSGPAGFRPRGARSPGAQTPKEPAAGKTPQQVGAGRSPQEPAKVTDRVPETVRSALSIFGGRLVDDSPAEDE